MEFLERGELACDAFDEIGQPSGLVVGVGDREDVDPIDIVTAAGSCDSSYVPRMGCEPTTVTSGCSMI